MKATAMMADAAKIGAVSGGFGRGMGVEKRDEER